MDELTARGTVVRWSDEEGWGVLRSDAVDGSVFAHFSHIRDVRAYRSLRPGQPVWFRWELPGQDGCDARAVDVWTAEPRAGATPVPPPPSEPGGASTYTLTITWDDPATPDDPPDGSPPRRP